MNTSALLRRMTRSQRETARRLGVSEAAVSRYASGKREPTPALAEKLAKVSGHALSVKAGRWEWTPHEPKQPNAPTPRESCGLAAQAQS